MKFMNNAKRFSVGILLLWTAIGGLAQTVYDQSGTPFASPADASEQQQQAKELTGKRGQEQVDLFTGSFDYSIPISCPPARNSSEPNLTLGYSSSGENGWCGMGWNLDIGFIERNTKDGSPIKYSSGAPLNQYDDSKGFILNLFGKELKLFAVATNSSVVEYRAETDTDFLRCFLDTSNNKWTVYDKSGDAYYFGETASSRVINPKTGWGSGYNATFHWALDQIATASGDWTTVAYTTYTSPNTGLPERTLYPTQITYNGHTNFDGYSANVAGVNKIIFQTELRTNDWRFSYRWGFRTEQDRRLTNILCQVGSQDVWNYRLIYGISKATYRSLLTNVIVSGFDTGNNPNALLTNTLAYQGNVNAVSFGSTIRWTNLVLNTPGTSSGSYEPYVTQANQEGAGFNYAIADLVDMDGDGLPDRVNYDSSTSPNQYMVQKNLGFQNGNGSFGSRHAFGPTSTGSGSASTSNPIPDGQEWAALNTPYGRIRDINGDGLPDRVMDYWASIDSVVNGNYPYIAFTNYEVMLNTGKGFSGANAWPVSTGPLPTTDANASLYYCIESGGVNVGFLDMNGDGRPDRIMSGWYSQGAMTNFMVQFNTGTNFTQSVKFGPYYSQNYNGTSQTYQYIWAGIETPEAHLTDINGDGLPDRVMWPMNPSSPGNELPHPASFFATEYDDGYSFESTNTSTGVPGAYDKWPGVVAQANNGTISYDGYTFWSDAIWDLPFGGLYDLNGDGLPDRVVLDQTSLNTATTRWFVYLNNGHGFNTTPITVSGIENQGHYSLSTDVAWWSPQCSYYGSLLTTLVDINGDGLLDRVMCVYDSGNGVANSTSNYFLVQLNQGPYPDLLTNINNGMGGSYAITYKSSTTWDNRTDPTDPNSGSRMPFPMQTVASVTESDGINPPRTNTYSYAGGFYDGVRREFQGFAVVTNIDPTLRMTVTYFHTGGGRNYSSLGEYQDTNSATGAGNFAKAGMAYRIETYGNNNKLYNVVVNQINQASLGNGRYFPFTQLKFDCDYLGDGTTTHKDTATQFTYDTSTGNVTNEVDYGQVTGFNPTSVGSFSFTDADGTDTKYHNTHYATISGNSYIVDHPDDVSLTDGSGNIIQEQKYGYNDDSGTIAAKLTRISAGYYATNSYASYTTYGLVGLTTDPVGVQTEITYDSTYNTYPATTRLRVIPGSDSGNDFITTSAYDPRSGSLAISTDPAGLTVSNSFDIFLRPTETDKIPIGGGSVVWENKISYPAVLKPIVSGVATNYIDVIANDGVGGVESRVYVDGFDRPIQTRTQGENGNYRVVSTAYDGRGESFLTTWPQFESSVGYTKPANQTASWTGFDAAGRMATNRLVTATFTSGAFSSKTDLAGDSGSPLATKTWSYVNGTDPWWIICTDEDGQVRRYGLDAFGRTNQIQEVDGSSTYTNLLKYDLADNLTNLVNANGENIYWAYNDAGGVVAMADPYLGQWTYQRDYDDRLRVQTDGRGDVIKQFYINPATGYQDPLGRVQWKEIYSTNYTTHSLALYSTVTNLYDSGDGSYTVYKGLPYATIDSQGWEKDGYDPLERTIKGTRYLSINANSYTTTNGYDDGDNVTAIGYPNSGPTILYSYFHGGSINQVSRSGGSAYYTVSAGNYDEFGHVTSFAYGNSLTTTRSYYSNSKRLQSISAGSVFSRNYQYTAGNDVTAISGTGISGTMSVVYYNLHRIKSYSGLSGNYGYNPVGTITNNVEGGGSSYYLGSARKQEVKSAFGMTNLYDLCGNMILRHGGTTNSQALVYDPENQLILLSQAGVLVDEFGYAADGARLWKRIDQSATNIQVWIGNIYEEKGGKILFHIFAGSQQICTFEPTSPLNGGSDSNAVGYYYHEDNLNTSSTLSDSSGSQTEVNVYYPFGRTQTASPQASFQVSRRFTGQVFDAESGLYYYNARYYDPELGRFTQPDTAIPDLSNPQSYNRYSYVLNDPLRYTDPSGHSFLSNFNPSLLWDPEVYEGIGYAIIGNNSVRVDPNSYQGLMANNGTPLLTELTDANGNKLGNPATAVVKAGGGALLQAGTMMTPIGDEGLAIKEGENVVKSIGEKIAGEAKGDTYLYQKIGANGEHLKFGITKNPETRYTKEELNGGRLKIIGQGSRKDMLQLERNLHETMPIGPEEGQKIYIQKQTEKGLQPPPYPTQ
jgi:RHS repeat-associated protein